MTDHHNTNQTAQTLLDLIQKQKSMNSDMIRELETIHPSHPKYGDIRYLKVLLDSSSTHILKDLTQLSHLMPKEDAQ
ncbi:MULTISPECIES: hypothetical protein [Bacillus]|uniref:Uncharacterized protein n=1 Tax=Bacillus pumilus (strain SAFR-032) TaxID=315750 RepID=A8FHT3_BACP2|nr:hypothetical protein [Bacillus pumilus]ABV63800.1 hypothetical protein BPUM_3146 [Bacillus pumilus SAFR-032]AVI42474.1 hypothetical protein C5Y82_16220 [Bacillus pumilus]MBC3641433.1 hypothetical protein [Bacillus pumilus]MBC3647061.1 hypothetical protein [Bacillus pumilus]MBC3651316.1 hypothetical protein [Bacillus pumilus]